MAEAPNKDEVVEQSDEDIFAEAFGQAVAAADEAAPAQEPEKKEEEKKDEKPADAPKDGEGAAPSGEESKSAEGGGEEQKSSGDSDESVSQGDEGDQKTVEPAANPNAELIEAIKSLAPKPEEKKEEPPKKEDPPARKAPDPFKYADADAKFLEEYSKEWDEHAKAQDLREQKLRHEITTQLVHQFSEAFDLFAQQLEQGLAPLLESHVQFSQDRHVNLLKQAHPDYEELRPQVSSWIEKQPKFIRSALQETYDKGNTEDVIELYSKFKAESGIAPKQTETPRKTEAPKKDEVPADKVADLAPVTSKRSSVETKGVDASDFDAGFAEALAAMSAG